MKKIVPGSIPPGYDLYTSWVSLQQQRPEMHVVLVFENGGKMLVRKEGDKLSLHSIFHSANDPGLLNAGQRLLKDLRILSLPAGVKLLGVCEEEHEPDCSPSGPWYVLIKVPTRTLVTPPDLFWFDPRILVEDQNLDSLVLASATVLLDSLQSTVVPATVEVAVSEQPADQPVVKPETRQRASRPKAASVAVAAGQ